MKVNKTAWNISVNYRSNYLSEVQQYFNFSPSQLATLLTEVACKAGYTKRTKPITGGLLIADAKSGKAPLWLCRAALDLILAQGYLPESDEEWISMVSLLVLDEEYSLSKRFVESLPKQINKYAFKEWVEIAA
ncbi:hypothetical protein [Aliikangiella maris]|uniref:Uncharacterized protein n=2 Tax=Aliikangiella maris TaxID=3162458 RepID=A0ABV2BYC4_9GAMM